MATPLNKSSAYVQSLVDFILDTKPYHSKLTEIVEEYQFFDNVNVKIEEATFVRSMHKAAWLYNYFSGGNPSLNSFVTQRVYAPDFNGLEHNSDPANNPGRWKAGRDENTDMASVPLVFSKKQFDGVGVADAWMELDGTGVLPYVEGHDFYQSHGSLEFQVRQIFDPLQPTVLKQTWAETRTNSVISQASATTMTLEQDLARPQAAINKLITLVTSVQLHLQGNVVADPNWTLANDACTALLIELNGGTIPPPWTVAPGDPNLILTGYYSEIIEGGAAALPLLPPPGFVGWMGEDGVPDTGPVPPRSLYVDEAFSALLPPLLFGLHSDIGLHQTGELFYADAGDAYLTVSNVVADPALGIEEWTLVAINTSPSLWRVIGSHSGIAGIVAAGSSFSSPRISFDTVDVAPPIVGATITLTPTSQFTIHPDALLETWNIIKVNPRTYTRPTFASTRYGYIIDLAAVVGSVSLTDPDLAPGTYVIALTSPTTFDVTSTADPLYSYSGTVGTVFNDGGLGFTLINGSGQAFQAGDFFLVNVVNGPATVVDFGLYYGYDIDSYDNPELVYNNTDSLNPDFNRFIDFRFDSRFTDYDVANMNLVVTQDAVDGRSFRLVAKPEITLPIETMKQDGTTVTNAVDLTAEGFEVSPVTVTGNPPVFSMPGDPNPAVDVELYYANEFILEYSDDGFATTTVVGLVPVGGSFSDPLLGISFDLVAGSKPFIGASCDDGLLNPRVEGGDVFFFTVRNPPPTLTNAPISIMGANIPRLIMHGDSYYSSIAADWTITFSSVSAYTVNALYNSGPLSGTQVPGYPVSGTLSLTTANPVANATYKDDNVHFTIVTGSGVGAGDTFTFQTHERRPSFLVHGSVTGWTEDAEYDRWYYNGSIGFKIKSPTLEVFDAAPLPTQYPEVLGYFNFPVGFVQLNYLRPDVPELVYTFTRSASGFLVRRSDLDVQGHCQLSGVYEDQYLKVTVADTTQSFQLKTKPDDFTFWNAQDTVIVRSDIAALNPSSDDYVVVKKTEMGTLIVNLDYESALAPLPDISVLAPVSIDADFIDVTTGYGGVPLSVTSPEVELLTGWLPTFTKKLDTTTSVAEFPDVADIFEVYSAATGQLVGTLKPQTTPFEEPTIFQFDSTFFSTYLPLNAQANVLTLGTGLDENVRVLISEKLNILEAGSAIFENALFNDNIVISVDEEDQKFITSNMETLMSVDVEDSPFGGFLPGYDNLPYDAEDALSLNIVDLTNAQGQYDTGLALVDHYLRAQYLSTLALPTPAEQTELTTLLALISNYLQPGGITATSLPDFLAALDADPYISGGLDAFGFGLPKVGSAIDINRRDTEAGSAAIEEAFSIQILDQADSFDALGFDTNEMDAYGGRSALMFPSSLPPIGTNGMDYATTDSPLDVGSYKVGTFELAFSNAPPAMPTPTIVIWRPADTSPQPVGVVQVISNGRFRFTVPVPTEAKVVVS